MTAPNNAILYNAAISGMVAGSVRGRRLTAVNTGTPPAIGTADPSYAAIASECTAFATEVDGALPNDHAGAANPTGTQAISVITTGVGIVPSTGAIQMGQVGKARLLESLCLGIIDSRYYAQPVALTSAQFASLAALIKFAYDLYAIVYVQPVTAPATINNQMVYFAAFNATLAAIFAGNPDVSSDSNTTIASTAGSAAAAVALAVDAGIAYDAAISQGASNGLPAVVEPDATNSVQLAELGKYRLVHSITLAVLEARNTFSMIGQFSTNSPAIADWGTKVAAAIIAMYKASVGDLQTAPTTGGTPLNPGLWNEAYCGFIAGNLAGRPITSTSSTDTAYEDIAAAAQAFANEVDAVVGASDFAGTAVPTGTQAITNATGEGSGNCYIVPTTGTIQEGELGKSGIMWAICRGTNHGRPLLNAAADTVAATYTNVAKGIVALYLELATVLNTP